MITPTSKAHDHNKTKGYSCTACQTQQDEQKLKLNCLYKHILFHMEKIYINSTQFISEFSRIVKLN